MASKQVLGKEWELTYAFQEFQSETKQNSIAIVKHLVYISLDIFLWQIFPLCDDNGVGIVMIVFVSGGILY